MKSVITLEVTHDEPLKDLPKLIAKQAWAVAGVTRAEVVRNAQMKDSNGLTVAELALGSGEVHRS